MEIKPSYSIGETVFFIYNNKVESDKISWLSWCHGTYHTQMNIVKDTHTIFYRLENYGKENFGEHRLFPTKQELINSL